MNELFFTCFSSFLVILHKDYTFFKKRKWHFASQANISLMMFRYFLLEKQEKKMIFISNVFRVCLNEAILPCALSTSSAEM